METDPGQKFGCKRHCLPQRLLQLSEELKYRAASPPWLSSTVMGASAPRAGGEIVFLTFFKSSKMMYLSNSDYQ